MTLSGDYFFLGMVILSIFFTWYSDKRKNILVAMVAFLFWFSLGMWLFFSASPPVGFGDEWKELLGWSFLVLAFLPWVFQMDTEIRHESEGHSWSSWGSAPRRERDPYQEYRERLFQKTRRRP